jgi:hypothetical protein
MNTFLSNSGPFFTPFTPVRLTTVTNTPRLVKSSSGNLFSWNIINTVGSVIYLKFFDKATAPSVGTDTPILTISIPASSSIYLANSGISQYTFTNGLYIACTLNLVDTDNTAPGGAVTAGIIYL